MIEMYWMINQCHPHSSEGYVEVAVGWFAKEKKIVGVSALFSEDRVFVNVMWGSPWLDGVTTCEG